MEAASRKFLGWQQRKFNTRLNRPLN
jgi:hypothetical protein